jgi:dTDP-4-amino-4,6-dideoxygalactose transaminase
MGAIMTAKRNRIFLSPPHMGGEEQDFVRQAFESNYVAPLGPMVDAFEQEFAEYTGIPHCLALNSGTAAMHLALRHRIDKVGRRKNGRPIVLASTLTFVGSVTPAVFEGCELRFIDCERRTWGMDPGLLEEELDNLARKGCLPVAVVPTDLYGHCCDLPAIVAICDRFEVPVICDSAEAMGAAYEQTDRESGGTARQWVHAGHGAWAAVYSFNGNKIITTSGGGMLASHDKDLIDHARKLSQQAREPTPWYEHEEIGYNYRLSNVLAAIGRGQLRILDDRVRRKRELFEAYRGWLGDVPGISFMPEATGHRANRWLTVALLDGTAFGATPEEVRLALERENVEARPLWKPMHLQPVFRGYPCRAGETSEELFRQGICLPSGTAMTHEDVETVGRIVRERAG